MSSEPITLRERYSRAMSSSHLQVHSERRGAADIIAAAGMAAMPDEDHIPEARTGIPRATIGALLFRLMAEYDEVRGPRSVARRNFESDGTREKARDEAAAAIDLERRRRRSNFIGDYGRPPRAGEYDMTPEDVRALVVQADVARRDRIAHEAKMAHAFVLMRLPSLASTKRAFGEWALLMANKRRFMDVGPLPVVDPEKSGLVAMWREGKRKQQTVVAALAGQVLDLVLDPNCYRCEGRGFNGGYSHAPQRVCNDERKGGCGGTGRRPTDRLGNCKEQSEFAAYLLMEVDIMLGRVSRDIKEKLRDTPALAAA